MISIVGSSGSGKTFLLEKLIPLLKSRGYRVVAAKHSHHKFDLDFEGKDSFRLFQAGAEAVLLFSPQDLVYFAQPRKEMTASELPRLFPDQFDLLLVEGFRRSGVVKIETHRHGELLCSPEELWAVVSDEELELPPRINRFSWQQIPQLTGLIEKTFLSSPSTLELYVNGQPVLLKPFVQEIISKTVLGMVSSLKEVSEVKRLELKIRA